MKKDFRNILLGTSLLGALTLSSCSGEKSTTPKSQTQETTWLRIWPTQCDENSETPWQRDKRENPHKYANSYGDLEDIYWYYDVYGKIPLKRIVKELYLGAVCLACFCPDREIFYLEVPESKADSLIVADGFVRYNGFEAGRDSLK